MKMLISLDYNAKHFHNIIEQNNIVKCLYKISLLNYGDMVFISYILIDTHF